MSLPTSDRSSETSLTFSDLNLSGPVLEAILKSGYTVPTPIQAGTIPLLLEGRDVIGQAQTGTGKTAAFALPMLARIDPSKPQPQVLVLTPTRELAIQVADAFERYSAGQRLRVAAIYGGQDYQIQFRQLTRGVHVVVGTPGRVMDHIRRGSLKLDGLVGLVLDEADEMLRMGFADDVEWVLTQSPAERQIALFSATLPETIRRIAQRHLRNPAEITIGRKSATAETVRQRFVVVGGHQKDAALARILEAEPIDGVIVFVKTKSTTEPLAEFLASRGHKTAALSSDIAQKQRERIVDGLRSGKIDVIIATDVAARGLDVQRVSHVVNYDLPFDSEGYVHRIGRTGRAGRSGNAILFVQPRERQNLRRLEQATRQTIEPMEIPSNRIINQRRTERFHERITVGLGHRDLENFGKLVEEYRAKHDVPLEQIAAALAALAAGDAPLFLTEEMRQAGFSDQRPPLRGGDVRPGGPRRSFEERRAFAGGPDAEARPPRRPRAGNESMETFRIEVGRAHRIKPSNIVGAIANEAGLDGSLIGRIEIFDEFSTIDMPAGMPHDLFMELKQVSISGRRLNISRVGSADAGAVVADSEGGAATAVAPAFKPRRSPPRM